MKVTADLTMGLANPASTRSLSEVLAPDNDGLPAGLKLSTAKRGTTLRYRVESESPSAAVTTVLALLRDVSLFNEVWLLSHGQDARRLMAQNRND